MEIILGRKTFGIICLIIAIAIILSSALLGPNAQYSRPYIPESIYFSNLDEYAGKEVYITASIAGKIMAGKGLMLNCKILKRRKSGGWFSFQ